MTDQPFPTVLENMARELDRLASLAGHIDSAVGHVPISSDMTGETMATLQRVDLLRQSLECLTHYVGSLAGQVNESVLVNPVNAAEALPLRDLARDLAGDEAPEGATTHSDRYDPFFF